MRQIDELTQTAVEDPSDHTARRVLSDAVRAHDYNELADAVESKGTGPKILRDVSALSRTTGLPVSFNLLWAAFFLVPRLPPVVPPSSLTGLLWPSPPASTDETPFVPRPPKKVKPWSVVSDRRVVWSAVAKK